MLLSCEPCANVTLVKAIASRNASCSIAATPDGMVMEVKLVAF